MKIKNINFDDHIVVLSSNEIEIECNFWDDEDIKCDKITCLFAYGVKDIFLSDNNYYVKKVKKFEYNICGKVTDIKKKMVQVFDFYIILDEFFPGDIKINDFISFNVNRIDA